MLRGMVFCGMLAAAGPAAVDVIRQADMDPLARTMVRQVFTASHAAADEALQVLREHQALQGGQAAGQAGPRMPVMHSPATAYPHTWTYSTAPSAPRFGF